MRIEDYKKGLSELSQEDLTELLRGIRTSRAKPKASNKKRKERALGTKKPAVSKNQMLNLINGMSEEDTAKLLAMMEDSSDE